MSSYRFEDAEKKEGDCEIAANVASAVHYLPFKIEYEGTANVKRYFTDTAQPHADLPDVLLNRFRGRPIVGKKLELPGDYEGLVLSDCVDQSTSILDRGKKNGLLNGGDDGDGDSNEGEGDVDDDSTLMKDSKTLRIVQRFDTMTYWNWDKTPNVMDDPVKLVDWMELSQTLHEPVKM